MAQCPETSLGTVDFSKKDSVTPPGENDHLCWDIHAIYETVAPMISHTVLTLWKLDAVLRVPRSTDF